MDFITNHLTLIWISFGLILLTISIGTQIVEFLIFGQSAIFVGLIFFINDAVNLLSRTPTEIYQYRILFSVIFFLLLSVLQMIFLRERVKKILFKKGDETPSIITGYTNDIAEVIEDIIPPNKGKVSYRGTNWSAISDTKIERGETVKIVEAKGNSIVVKPINHK